MSKKKNQIIPFALKDMGDEDSAKRLRGRVEVNEQGIFINLEGYGEKTSNPEQSFPIMVEFCEGEPRVVVWADINREDCTHDVHLSGAAEKKRAPEPIENGLTATFRPQASVNDYCVDIDGAFKFDVTKQILSMSLDEIKNFQEHNEDSDRLADDFNDHDGPFEVDTDIDEWLNSLEMPERAKLTQNDLDILRKRFGVEAK